jgi:hypothetical protein
MSRGLNLEPPFPGVYDDERYEIDVFNVIRRLFPYAENWGGVGKCRPDGFCSLVYFVQGDLHNEKKHNWSYDAKFTRKQGGYLVNSAEERKIWDYVAALLDQTELWTRSNQLNAHVIISNNLAQREMEGAAAFLRREHRLGKDHPGLKLVFMMDEFLRVLYDRVCENDEEFRRRWFYLPLQTAKIMMDENAEGYVYLNRTHAEALCKWVLDQSAIENPPNLAKLRRGLDQTMTKS